MSSLDVGYKAKCNHCNESIIMYQWIHGCITRCPWCSYYISLENLGPDKCLSPDCGLHMYPPTWADNVTRLSYYPGDIQ